MRPTLFAFVLCALHGTASAQPRLATPDLSCAEAAGLVARVGAIVMTTGPFTYARFVRDGGFCPLPETTRPAFETTRDVPRCFVGYTCHDRFTEGASRD
jgi:hypothetical protein